MAVCCLAGAGQMASWQGNTVGDSPFVVVEELGGGTTYAQHAQPLLCCA